MAINAGKNFVSGALNGKFNASCFAAGTMIETADGDRPIEEIQIGDLVLSANPETGEIAYKPVVNTYVHVTDTVLYLTIDEEIIETTEDHPFWVEGQGWTSAKLLQPGDVVWLKDGSTQCVDDIEIVELPEGEYVAVYNFEVADFHTYFVSDYDVLVHNKCKYDTLPNRKQAFNQAKDLAGVPRSQQSVKQWTVGGDATRKSMKNYRYSKDAASHGRFYQYDTPKGPRVIVEHTGDTKQGKHFHAGMPKGEFTTTYNFKKYRYRKIINPKTNDHHIRYK